MKFDELKKNFIDLKLSTHGCKASLQEGLMDAVDRNVPVLEKVMIQGLVSNGMSGVGFSPTSLWELQTPDS